MLPNRLESSRLERGFSLVEVVVVLVIVAIIITFAIMTLGNSKENIDRQNIAREFKVSLERARFDSVKRRASVCSDMSRVTINSSGSYSVSTDLDQNGSLNVAVETRRVDFANRAGVTLVGNGVTLPITIRFDERGRAFLRADCDPSSIPTASVPLFYFCNGACTVATANSENANAIFISPALTRTPASTTGCQYGRVYRRLHRRCHRSLVRRRHRCRLQRRRRQVPR
ncbi:MAG: hypothetical protein DMF63_01045 [Acidobacteria bacterium]|nr:MAG: hypothetical protein DMF63_01045 [Acidobacteriota bacterium]